MGHSNSKKKQSLPLKPAQIHKADGASDETSVEEEWTELVETFLEENVNNYFWAQPFLGYFREKFMRSSKFSATDALLEPLSHPGSLSPNTKSLRTLVDSLDKLIKVPSNPFNQIILEFRQLFLAEFIGKLGEYGAGIYRDYKKKFDDAKAKKVFSPKKRDELCSGTKIALNNIQAFIKLMVESLSMICEPLIGEHGKVTRFKEMIANALVDLVVNEEIHEVIFMLIRLEDQAEEVLINKKIKEFQFVRPQYLGIDPFFCLDGVNSYRYAVDKLREVSQQKSPLKKLETISYLSQAVCSCVDKFWEKQKVKVPVMIADQFLCILIYLVVQAKIPNLFTHVAVANELAQLGSRNSYNTYCLNSLWACFYHLLNVEPKYTIIGSGKGARRSVDDMESCTKKKTRKISI